MLQEYNLFWNSSRGAKSTALNLSPIQVYSLASIANKEKIKADERL